LLIQVFSVAIDRRDASIAIIRSQGSYRLRLFLNDLTTEDAEDAEDEREIIPMPRDLRSEVRRRMLNY